MTKYLLAALAVLAVAAVMLAMHFRGTLAVSRDLQHQAEQRAAQLDASLKASEAARDKEHAQSEHFRALSGQYEQDKSDAEARASKLAADLRAERVRLRPEWRCEVPAAPASAGKPDAAADDRSKGAADIVRAAAAADAQIRGLQAILRAERQ